jgi:hypothetical protein
MFPGLKPICDKRAMLSFDPWFVSDPDARIVGPEKMHKSKSSIPSFDDLQTGGNG